MLRADKERVVAELAERLRSTNTLMVADYRGLSMPEIEELRARLLEAGARFTVVKNTLTKLAAEAAGTEQVLELIDGPTAIAFLDADGDPAAVAKVLNDTAKAHEVLVLRGGLLDGIRGRRQRDQAARDASACRRPASPARGRPRRAVDDRRRALHGPAERSRRRPRRAHPPARGAGRGRAGGGGAGRGGTAGRGACRRGSTRVRTAARRAVGRSRAGFGRTRGGDQWRRLIPTSSSSSWGR